MEKNNYAVMVNIVVFFMGILSMLQLQRYFLWVQKPTTIDARNPSIPVEKYQETIIFVEEAVKQGKNPNLEELPKL